MRYIEHKFTLQESTVEYLKRLKPEFGYGVFGEICYYRTYSRKMADGKNESWADTVIRVINGIMSIRKNHYINNTIEWDDARWQEYAFGLAVSMFKMEWLPPGRGLWACGTDFVAERGSMALYNCSFTNLTSTNFADDIYWLMDCLMLGVGVGFSPINEPLTCTIDQCKQWKTYVIPDSREGWAMSVKLAIEMCTQRTLGYNFDYSLIRPHGLPIAGFGGTASGPEPLMKLHVEIQEQFWSYNKKEIDVVQLKTNIANLVGVCVVAGNVRRSAELGIAPITDETFLDLKDYDKHPNRKAFGWMSNNTVALFENSDFEKLGLVSARVPVRGEPGIANLRNFPFGRVGKRNKYPVRPDKATGLNPCGEITLEHREVCNISETFPTRCVDEKTWLKACEYATFYCSTVSLLPTHDSSTNAVMLRNRRIGVGIVDFVGWVDTTSLNNVVGAMNRGYKRVRKANRMFNAEAGVPEAIKVTTVKPGGTVPKLAGRVSGVSYPTFNHTLRRINVAAIHPIAQILKNANVPYVENPYDKNTLIFGVPILQKGTPADCVSLWEQTLNLITIQRHWADNAVSNTLYFRPKWRLIKVVNSRPMHLTETLSAEPEQLEALCSYFDENEAYNILSDAPKTYESQALKVSFDEFGTMSVFVFDPEHEEDIIERVLAHAAPHIKSLSLLPHSAKGAYENMPEEGITEHEYNERLKAINPIDWSSLTGSDGINEKYCTGDVCER